MLSVNRTGKYRDGARWLPGHIEQKSGPVSFQVRLTDGRIVRCHQDQLRKRSEERVEPSISQEIDEDGTCVPAASETVSTDENSEHLQDTDPSPELPKLAKPNAR